MIDIQKTRHGFDHPGTLNSVDKLAIIYREQGRVEEAEELKVYCKTKLGANHPDTLMAEVYRRLVDELSVAKKSS